METAPIVADPPANEGDDIGEDLLKAWVEASVSIINERLVSVLTYKEALVCRVLCRAGSVQGGTERGLTATELCQTTRMVKSQMNHIITSLEQKGAIVRARSTEDRRRIEILLDNSPEGLYQLEHRLLVDMATRIASKLGEKRAREVTAALTELSSAADATLAPAQTERGGV